MRTNGRTLGISTALLAILGGQGCFTTADDCALNLCEPRAANHTTTSSGGATGGGGGAGGEGGTSGATAGTGGATGTGGTGGSGGAPVVSCDPGENDGPVADTCGVFVSSAGSDSGNGTKASPYLTLKKALEQAAGGTHRVYACSGEFHEAVEIGAGISLFGGLACNDGWSHDGVQRTTISANAGQIPLRLTAGADPTTLRDLTVHAADATAPGGSSIVAIADGVTVALVRCDLVAGDAMDGAPGADGGDPTADASGGSAGAVASGNLHAPPTAPLGGAAGSSVCDGFTLLGGQGGLGGLAPNGTGKDGEAGDFGAGGIAGKGAGVTCSNGGPGAIGQDGVAGAGGISDLLSSTQIDASGYHGPAGETGAAGTSGASGGGGGGSKAGLQGNGAGGGGGGAGGCGGKPGTGGMAGGSSIALVSLNATINLSQVAMHAGRGGNGGKGGNGQFGQIGGAGGPGGSASNGVSGACDGGHGGQGGNGGPGGGGAGGYVLGVAFVGRAPAGSITMDLGGVLGAGGLGGTNGIALGGDGAAGQKLPMLAFQ